MEARTSINAKPPAATYSGQAPTRSATVRSVRHPQAVETPDAPLGAFAPRPVAPDELAAAWQESADRLGGEARQALRRGVVSMDRAALEAHAAAEWERIGMTHEADATVIEPNARRRHRRLG